MQCTRSFSKEAKTLNSFSAGASPLEGYLPQRGILAHPEWIPCLHAQKPQACELSIWPCPHTCGYSAYHTLPVLDSLKALSSHLFPPNPHPLLLNGSARKCGKVFLVNHRAVVNLGGRRALHALLGVSLALPHPWATGLSAGASDIFI